VQGRASIRQTKSGDSDPFPDLLIVRELAELLRVSPKGIYSLVEQRKTPFVKVSAGLIVPRKYTETKGKC